MTFTIKGDYFHNNFYLPPTTGLDSSYKLLTKTNPANNDEKLWECPIDSRHITPVVESAEIGFNSWKKTSWADRCKFIEKFLDIVQDKKDQITRAISMETGRPLWETQFELKQTIQNIRFSIPKSDSIISSQKSHEIDQDDSLGIQMATTRYRPIGPVLIISSFCHPFLIPVVNIINAMLSGSSIILKPSPYTCYTAQLIIECFHEAQFPLGVINCINGKDDISRRLLNEKNIKGVLFTGSKEVGLKVLDTTHQDLSKVVSLQLSTKNTSIIHEDCNIDFVLNELLTSAFLSSGQNCTSTSLVAIHKNIQDEFISRFHQLAKKIIIDHPIDYDMEPFMGPVIDKQFVDNYILYIGMAKREGIEEIMRGKQIDKKFKGNYVTPSIHLSTTFNKNSRFMTSEIIAPTCTFIPYDDIEEAICISNNTEFGLISSVYSQNESIIEKSLSEIQCGLININIPTTTTLYHIPYGGIKNSGNHRQAAINTVSDCIYPISSLSRGQTENNGTQLIGLSK
ncbi:MAG: aldehyde dehydrogenase family protein [Bacteriovoracaceae bacterium]|nr:aldehyde dehydrogenase family protein [Bacteriovoracaceae bacterium]